MNGSVVWAESSMIPRGGLVQSFSISLNDSQIKALGGDLKSTIIFEAELLALVVAASLWQPLFGGCPTVFYVDNNPQEMLPFRVADVRQLQMTF